MEKVVHKYVFLLQTISSGVQRRWGSIKTLGKPSRGGNKEEGELKPPQVSRICVDRKYTAGRLGGSVG